MYIHCCCRLVGRLGVAVYTIKYIIIRETAIAAPIDPIQHPTPTTAQERAEAVNEVSILASINSPFIVRYYDSFVAPAAAGVGGGAARGGAGEDLHIVMEYCNR